MAKIAARNVISGHKGKVLVEIDGLVKDFGMIKSWKATVEKTKEEISCIGDNWVRHKAGKLKGTGEMALYDMVPEFKEMLARFAKTSIDTYFKMIVVNDDEGSNSGTQTTVFTNCNIDSGVVAQLDESSAALTTDISFTFSGFEIISSFKEVEV